MNIGEALLSLLYGRKVYRESYSLDAYLIVNPASKAMQHSPDKLPLCDILLIEKLSGYTKTTPWKASKEDLIATDWSICE